MILPIFGILGVAVNAQAEQMEAPKMFLPENDALSLEYKLHYGCATGYLRLADIVDDSAVLRELGILCSTLEEQLFDFAVVGEAGPALDDAGNSALIGLDRIKALE